ncbi:four-carbon acid sugar kinase family protein [Fundicoccus culcitae]|uniref:Hydroxyacid dehydrogenase n=1 Tax=Fundicoccus culcitae TaxID=2969821 RepID=A0ABY5P4B4_9LACT|nr:four-carbon acid sugar kinase family protein [Fundicoccus culcitae]UUX33537.1 hydroxyacid dehydrogenase [Fundicoccus culcitae]
MENKTNNYIEDEIELKLINEKPRNLKIIVLDDDPTGSQTLSDVPIYTAWDENTLRKAFKETSPMFYILTNSRALSKKETIKVHSDIMHNLTIIGKSLSSKFLIVSRSDSTLRGHYPIETQIISEFIPDLDGEIICPAFIESGRVTIDNVHYIMENNILLPVNKTEFAKDNTFGYENANLIDYIKEKHEREDISIESISLDNLRSFNESEIMNILINISNFGKIIVNAENYLDLKIFVLFLFKAINKGKKFVVRSAASIVKLLGIQFSDNIINDITQDSKNKNGAMYIIGSHTNLTTRQFSRLKKIKDIYCIELDVKKFLSKKEKKGYIEQISKLIDKHIFNNTTVVIYTQREVIVGNNKEESLLISIEISDSIQQIVQKLSVKPRYILTKGGITSSDIAVKALGVKKAMVMGQIIKGVSVWQLGSESKFRKIPFIVFPGNVGNEWSLVEIYNKLSV